MTDVDPAAVARERQALKDALTYRSVHHDTDPVLGDTERVMLAEANSRRSRSSTTTLSSLSGALGASSS